MLKYIAYILNAGIALTFLFIAFEEGADAQDLGAIILVIFLPLFNIFVIYSQGADKESLFSLWVQVRKKKLKDQLDK